MAQPDEEARRAFDAGKALYTSAKPEAALIEFEKAVALSNSPNARLMVARCLVDLGRAPEAYEALRLTARDANALASQDPKYAETRDAAASLLASLEPSVAKIVVVLSPALNGGEVRLGQRVISAAELSEPIAVTPGYVDLSVSLGGVVVTNKHVEVKAGITSPVALDRPATREVTPPGGGQNEVMPPPPPTLGPVRVAGIVIGSFGLAGLTSAAVTGGLVLDKQATLDEECGGRCPDDSHAALIEEGRNLQLGTNVALGIGGALTATGVLMAAFAPSSEAGESTPVPRVALGPLALSLGWTLE